MGVVETNVEKEGPGIIVGKEGTHKFSDAGNVATHLHDALRFLCVGELERIDIFWTHVFFSHNSSADAIIRQDVGKTVDSREGGEVVNAVMQAVHAILVDGETCEKGGTGGGAATDGGEGASEHHTPLCQGVQMRHLARGVPISLRHQKL